MHTKYHKYLQSNKWEKIREKVLERDEHMCQECGTSSSLEIHHKTYDHIFEEAAHLDDLITFCTECHATKHSSHIPESLLEEGLYSMADRRRFAKIYMSKIPDFSKKTYLSYWYLVCCHLSRDTNIVYNLKPKKHYIEVGHEFADICDCSQAAGYRFLEECRKKGYIKRLELKYNQYFIVNPNFAMNGNKIPVLLASLFDIKDKSC